MMKTNNTRMMQKVFLNIRSTFEPDMTYPYNDLKVEGKFKIVDFPLDEWTTEVSSECIKFLRSEYDINTLETLELMMIKRIDELELRYGTHEFSLDNRSYVITGVCFHSSNHLKEFAKCITNAIQLLPNTPETNTPQPISINESRTKKGIIETLTNMDNQGWQYAFLSEKDFSLFTDLLTNFFEYHPYTLPETTIQLKRTCKTKVAKALGDIHREFSNENKLITDTKYFQLIRVLSHFEKEKEGDLYKSLTR